MVSSFIAFFAVPSFSLGAAAAPASPERLATISVDAGSCDRIDTPVCVELPETILAWQPLRLVEIVSDSRVPTPSQIEAGNPPKLWWILSGKTRAASARRYELFRDVPVAAEGVEISMTPLTLDVAFGGQTLFRYNHAHVVPPKGVAPEFIRSGYIHPMFSPSGKLLTEDFPRDHHHHKGIWMPWTSTEFDGHHVDFWNLAAKQGTVQFAGFAGQASGPVFGGFKVKHEHIDLQQPNGGEVVLDEIWDVRLWAAGGPKGGMWLWDLTSEQVNVAESPLLLNAYRYGGIGYRGPKEWIDANYVVLSSEGKTKKDGHTTTSKWCAHSGAIDGKWTTVVVMCSPKNERFPEPMRIWDSGGCFFNYCPVQKEPLSMDPGVKHVFRYRFFIYEGEIDAKLAERAWCDFGDPPRATLSIAK